MIRTPCGWRCPYARYSPGKTWEIHSRGIHRGTSGTEEHKHGKPLADVIEHVLQQCGHEYNRAWAHLEAEGIFLRAGPHLPSAACHVVDLILTVGYLVIRCAR